MKVDLKTGRAQCDSGRQAGQTAADDFYAGNDGTPPK